MLTSERRALIHERLVRDGRIVATDLAREWNLSEDTIRRDLREMAAEGQLARVHGGALPLSPPLPAYRERTRLATDEKQRLGRAAATLIKTGQTVFIDGGSTHLALVAALPDNLTCTIVTHAPTIVSALENHPAIDVWLIGGRLYRHSMVAVGAGAAEAIGRITPDIAFLGVTGIDTATGLTTGDIEEAAIKRLFATRARSLVVLATREKIGVASPATVLPLSEATHLVVAEPIEPSWQAMAEQAGVNIIPAR